MGEQEYLYLKDKNNYLTKNILSFQNVPVANTIYNDSSEDFLNWPFNATSFFKIAPEGSCEAETAQLPSQNQYKAELDSITEKINSFSDSKYDFEIQEKIRELRRQKKELLEKISIEEKEKKSAIVYKNVVEINDFASVEEKLPFFKNTKWPFRNEMPYFTAALSEFSTAVKSGEPTAIFGGPCFFGEYEVDMIFSMKDGSKKVYDFTTRRKNVADKFSKEAEFTKTNAKDVIDVAFESHKTLLTTDEYDSFLYLFELAQATNSALTIPIPDFSYKKYLQALTESLPEEIQAKAMERFDAIAGPIIEMYRRLFAFFKKNYPEVKAVFMSSQEKELLDLYYKKRSPFVDKNSTKRIISGIQEKIEAVKDYITLPALPYYLSGIKNILEVDYLGETDSFWKCRKMHRGKINLSALLYPIKISRDGYRTLFSTELQYKEYIKEEDYGKL